MSRSNLAIVLLLSSLISIASTLSFADNINKKTILIFTASWCGPCHVMKNDIDTNKKLVDVIKNYDVIELDYDIDKDVVNGYNIKTVPTIVIMHKGKELNRMVGYSGINSLYNFLK